VSEFTVRRADLSDLSKIVELRLALLAEYADNPLYAQLHPDAQPRAWELYRTQVTSPLEAIFVAEHEGRIIGVLRCVDSPSSPLLLPERYCYVSSVYVEPAHRRTGVLREMLGRAVELALTRSSSNWAAATSIWV
jgi:GNAT superfamily N-acetyltransferase